MISLWSPRWKTDEGCYCKIKSVAGNVTGQYLSGPPEGYLWEIFAVGQIQDATGIAVYVS